jgi:type VI secretion system protein ImpH
MADEDRSAARALELETQLAGRAHAFDFFQALRRLEVAYRDKPRIGEAGRAIEDPVRLAQEPSLAFPPSTVFGYKAASGAESVGRLSVTFFGLLGPNGPLPLHLTEHARDRIRFGNDPTFVRF